MSARVDPSSGSGRVVDAALALLDHQIEDREHRPIGKVDDLELVAHDGTLYVDALLVGVSALAARLDGLVGAAVIAMHRRLHPERDPQPRRIPWKAVSEIGSSIQIARDETELAPNLLERWVDEQIISRIPGASHEGG